MDMHITMRAALAYAGCWCCGLGPEAEEALWRSL